MCDPQMAHFVVAAVVPCARPLAGDVCPRLQRLSRLQAGATADIDVLVLDIDKVDKDPGHRSLVLDRAMRTRDMDNERFLRKVRERLDRCAAHLPFLLDSPGYVPILYRDVFTSAAHASKECIRQCQLRRSNLVRPAEALVKLSCHMST